jgi:hypothetical protein
MANTIVVDIVADTRSLVKGVKQTNQQLGTLNSTATGISKGFGLITKALATIATAKFVWNIVQDFEKEQIAFAKIKDLFGKDADEITEKINNLSVKFKIDDGDVAQTFVGLANSTTIRYRAILDEIGTLVLFANNQNPDKGIDTFANAWTKALRSGKLLGGDELSKFGLTGQLSQAELENFQKLKTVTEQVKYLYKVLSDDINEDLKFTTTQELQYELEGLKDAISVLLLPILKETTPLLKAFVDLLTYKDPETGETKLNEEVKLLAAALGTLWTVGKLSAVVASAEAAGTSLGLISKELKAFPSLLKGLTFPEILAAFGILLKSIWDKLGKFSKGLVLYFVVEIGEKVAREIVKLFPNTWEEVGNKIIDGIMLPLKDPVKAVTEIVKNFWKGLKSAIIEWGKSIFMIASPSKVTEQLGKDIVAGIFVAFNPLNFVSIIASFFRNLLSTMMTQIKSISWSSLGTAIINGLVSGMQSLASAPLSFIGTLAKNMKDRFKSLFNISSPSKVMAGYGANLMQGLAMGIRGNAGLAVAGMGSIKLQPPTVGSRGSGVNITINAGIGTDPYEVGRYVKSALDKYAGVNGR